MPAKPKTYIIEYQYPWLKETYRDRFTGTEKELAKHLEILSMAVRIIRIRKESK